LLHYGPNFDALLKLDYNFEVETKSRKAKNGAEYYNRVSHNRVATKESEVCNGDAGGRIQEHPKHPSVGKHTTKPTLAFIGCDYQSCHHVTYT
jgi:hypothetical protein